MAESPRRSRRPAPPASQNPSARARARGRSRRPLSIEVGRGGCPTIDAADLHMVLGHSLSSARRRYLRHAEWVVVMDDSRPVGVAAYQPIRSDVRLVLEFLLDPALSGSAARRVTDMLLSTLEMKACEGGAHCLMLILDGGEIRRPFGRRGYRTVTADATGAWLQKSLVPDERRRVRTRRIH